MKFLDLFAGIGGFRLGMEEAGHECVGFIEIDKFARASYKVIHNSEGEFEGHDITKLSDQTIRSIGSVEVICGGFPCQAFSTAGNRRGFEDTRGTLFFEIARIASILRPKYLFLENVKGLLNHDKGFTFETIIRTLEELGYNVEWQVLNSKDFVPQNRERVYIIGHLRGESTRKIFPIIRANTGNSENHINSLNKKDKVSEIFGYMSTNRLIDIKGISPTLMTSGTPKIVQPVKNNEVKQTGYKLSYIKFDSKIEKTKIIDINKKESDQIANLKDFRIRFLTPKECWRLQGFPDEAFEKAATINSENQLYKQAGNSVTVSVIADIAKRL